MSTFKEISKQNSESVESFILHIFLLTNIGHMRIIVGLLFVRFLDSMVIRPQVENQKHLKKY